MSFALILLQSKPIPKDLKEIELINVVQLEDDTSVKRKGKGHEIQSFEDFELLLGSIRVQRHLRADPSQSRDRARQNRPSIVKCSKDPVREAHDLAKSVLEDHNATEMTFHNIIKVMLSEEFDAGAYQAYISRVKKSNSLNDELLSVNMFQQRIRVI
jgi:hypothetical protein